MNKEQQELLNEAYENYCNNVNLPPTKILPLGTMVVPTLYTQEEFINKCKTDTEFSEKWGLKIEERELTPKERIELAGGRIQDKYPALVEMSLRVCDERDIPTKLITITRNSKTIESYY